MFRVLAHRGASLEAPENTLSAFRLALEAGADGIELDVHLARDGVPVVVHDATLERVAPGDDRAVHALTSEALGRVDVGRGFGDAFAGETVPTLARVLDEFGGRTLLNLELKPEAGPHPDLVGLVVDAVRARGIEDRVLVTSFHAPTVARAKALEPNLTVGVILMEDVTETTIARHPFADGFGVPAFAASATGIALARGAGKDALVWIVNDPADAERWRAAGAAGVITDDPRALC